MLKLRDLYFCEICYNLVEIVNAGAPALVCCKQPMKKLESHTVEAGGEKHLPVVKEVDGGVLVEVGSVHHPMGAEHYIGFIEVLTEDQVLRAELPIDGKPVAHFNVSLAEVKSVRSFCNLHGLWEVVL